VPILQLALSGQGLAEQQLFDLGVNFLRPQLVTIPGVAIPYPFGGKQRQIMIDLDTRMLQAKGLAPNDVLNTLNLQNLVLPSGTGQDRSARVRREPQRGPPHRARARGPAHQGGGELHHLRT
jgi:multidrug efflux pump subunit AcrB